MVSSAMVTAMVTGVLKAAKFVGADSVKVIPSGPSTYESWLIRIVIGLLDSPAAKLSVPRAAVKSHLGEAIPFAVEHGRPESPLVA